MSSAATHHRRALVVFSGGQDSTTCLYWALKRFGEVVAITFDYGQKHSVELECAKRICERLGIQQKVVAMDFLAQLNENALTSAEVTPSADGGMHNLPNTFVPGRNALFLTLAAAYAVPRGIEDIIIGVCETDYSGYPDCREAFVSSIEKSLGLALDSALRLHRPLMNLSKGETFALAAELGALDAVIDLSHTCYNGDRESRNDWGRGCGQCPACQLRAKGWHDYQTHHIHKTSSVNEPVAQARAEASAVSSILVGGPQL